METRGALAGRAFHRPARRSAERTALPTRAADRTAVDLTTHNHPQTMIETTCVILKPDCLRNQHCGHVLTRFERAKLEIVGCKMMWLSSEMLAEHYQHLLNKPFYPEVETFMQSSPVIVLALAGENAVARVRSLAGSTNPAQAPHGTIRGDFGKDVMVNVVHASDSIEAAEKELHRFFSGEHGSTPVEEAAIEDDLEMALGWMVG